MNIVGCWVISKNKMCVMKLVFIKIFKEDFCNEWL